jgi:predicted O-methyltransferase YrrM
MKELIYKLLRISRLDTRSLNHELKKINSRHIEVSALYSDAYRGAKPSERLLKIFSALILKAGNQSYELFKLRKNIPQYVYDFPGEHYPVLQALVEIVDAKNIVEIGTYTGLSSVSFFHVLNNERTLTSVDIVPWNKIPGSALEDKDFETYNFTQILSNFHYFPEVEKHADVLKNADFIFCDGPKDTVFEKELLVNLQKLKIKNGCILLFDDIRQWNMLKIWHDIKMPKLDITSIGHFTGSGLIEWNNDITVF